MPLSKTISSEEDFALVLKSLGWKAYANDFFPFAQTANVIQQIKYEADISIAELNRYLKQDYSRLKNNEGMTTELFFQTAYNLCGMCVFRPQLDEAGNKIQELRQILNNRQNLQYRHKLSLFILMQERIANHGENRKLLEEGKEPVHYENILQQIQPGLHQEGEKCLYQLLAILAAKKTRYLCSIFPPKALVVETEVGAFLQQLSDIFTELKETLAPTPAFSSSYQLGSVV